MAPALIPAKAGIKLIGPYPRDQRMLRRVIVCLIMIIAGLSAAAAQHRRQIDATPFAHAPCSVLDGQPCTPTFCSVFNDGPCIPEIFYPYGQNLQLTIQSVPPADDTAREGMQMSVRFSFKRSGEIIATPQVTYATAGVPADTRAAYLKAINESLAACMPLKFTGGLGGALAGRPIAIRYVDNRDLGRQAEKP